MRRRVNPACSFISSSFGTLPRAYAACYSISTRKTVDGSSVKWPIGFKDWRFWRSAPAGVHLVETRIIDANALNFRRQNLKQY